MDCIEYMRGLPDNAFDIAVCDPPYGKGNDDNLVGGGGLDRDSKSILELRGQNQDLPTSRRFGGWFRRYDKPMEQTAGRTERKILQASGHTGSVEGRGQRDTKSGGGRKQKLHNGTSLLHRSSSMSFSASAAIR